eukprot:XP_003979906.2 PREDICTED: HLA class II histocompatibility antigen, DRB1-11 beta chain-like [Takifugu rubripes]
MSSSSLRVFLLFISLYTAGGFQSYRVDRCDFNSTDLKDIEYSRSHYYNKLMYVRFRSSVGKFEGYTKDGLIQADYWNNISSYLEQMRDEKERYCEPNIKVWYSNILSKSGKSAAPLQPKSHITLLITDDRLIIHGSTCSSRSNRRTAPPGG